MIDAVNSMFCKTGHVNYDVIFSKVITYTLMLKVC